MHRKRVLFAASEVYPFAKTGGLADVAHSLPKALERLFEVTVIMPLYRSIERDKFGIQHLYTLNFRMGETDYPVEIHGCRFEGIDICFVYSPILCDREFLYGPPESGYWDNALRFGIFSHAISATAEQRQFDVVHLNDWQCGIAALLLREAQSSCKSVFTIHNLAYQGVFDAAVLPALGIDPSCFTMDGIEFYDQVSFMKAGIAYADSVTTVSPAYAREILTPEFGCGLDGFLTAHSAKLSGILNGIDTEHFSPANDPKIPVAYEDAKGKAVNKSAYLKASGLKGVKKPLFAFIGRLTEQKGIDLLVEVLPKIAAMECNVAFVGEGEKVYCDALEAFAKEHKNIHVSIGYDEALSHGLHAAADFMLIPSRYEPCGLTQMIAFGYGAIPIVHHVGGLIDTVKKIERFSPDAQGGFGVTFKSMTKRSLLQAFGRALEMYSDRRLLNTIVNHNMKADFSWEKSALEYAALYRSDVR